MLCYKPLNLKCNIVFTFEWWGPNEPPAAYIGKSSKAGTGKRFFYLMQMNRR